MSESAERKSIHGQWSSRLAFILAATGSAVGLGNIWKFPYMTGEYGGGAFVLVYIISILFIGLPIMMAEVLLGRRGRQNPVDTIKTLALEDGESPKWRFLGSMGVVAGFLILSFYSVIAGWALAYVFRMASGMFTDASVEMVGAVFSGLTGDAERLIAWHTIFMVLTLAIVSRGVTDGLERAIRYLMPGLFLILIFLLCYSLTTGYFADGLRFMFIPDFDNFSFKDSVLPAMGMAFFSLSVGMGAIMMYGAYLPKEASIAKTTITVAFADTSVALIAGMAIFPIVLANGLTPAEGPGLIFSTLPLAFGQMPAGTFVGTLFFVLLVFAAITSAISLLEPPVAWLVENKKITRFRASTICTVIIWFIGLGTVFSSNIWEPQTLKINLNGVQYILFQEKTFFDGVDFLTSNIMLPLGGLLIAIFAVHIMQKESCEDELALDDKHFNIWYFILRYVTPAALLIIFLNSVGLLSGIVSLFSS